MSDPGMRLDRWLWFARFCKSRSLAGKLCQDRKVRINRTAVTKPASLVRPGDVLTFPQGSRIRVVKILALGERRGPPGEARGLYEDLAPAPEPDAAAPAEQAARDGGGRPTKLERRATDKLHRLD